MFLTELTCTLIALDSMGVRDKLVLLVMVGVRGMLLEEVNKLLALAGLEDLVLVHEEIWWSNETDTSLID